MRRTMSGRGAFMSQRKIMLKHFFAILILGHSILLVRPLFASDDKTKNSTTQQVGGLLFDVDEGVKIEHGPGGSVYLKSNREYMQEKLKSMDGKIEALEKRINRLESTLAREKSGVVKSGSTKTSDEKNEGQENLLEANVESGARVLVT